MNLSFYYIGGFQMVIPKYPDVPTLTKNKSIKLQKSLF